MFPIKVIFNKNEFHVAFSLLTDNKYISYNAP